MKSNIRDIGDTRIIELGGKITIGTGDVKIRELIAQALEEDKQNILFDLGGVTPSIPRVSEKWWPVTPQSQNGVDSSSSCICRRRSMTFFRSRN